MKYLIERSPFESEDVETRGLKTDELDADAFWVSESGILTLSKTKTGGYNGALVTIAAYGPGEWLSIKEKI